MNHTLNCPCGSLPSLRHNNLRDITASLFKEVCHNVTTEPVLHPLSGEILHPRSAITDDNAQSDIKVDGFWGCRQQSSFFDIKIFNPIASTYCKKSLSSCYCRLEDSKRREYQNRITHVEHGPFSPLIFTTSGGMGPSSSTVYKRLASLISEKRNDRYSKTLLFIHCKIGFALLRSAIQCLRGSRSMYICPIIPLTVLIWP